MDYVVSGVEVGCLKAMSLNGRCWDLLAQRYGRDKLASHRESQSVYHQYRALQTSPG